MIDLSVTIIDLSVTIIFPPTNTYQPRLTNGEGESEKCNYLNCTNTAQYLGCQYFDEL